MYAYLQYSCLMDIHVKTFFLYPLSLEMPRGLENAGKMGIRLDISNSGIQHKQLIKSSLLENESRYVFLYNQALPKFYTRERSWRDLIPHIFSFFSLFPLFFFYLFLRISYAGPYNPRLIGVEWAALRMYNGKPNSFGPKICLFFFLTLAAFRALSLHAREWLYILSLHCILPY